MRHNPLRRLAAASAALVATAALVPAVTLAASPATSFLPAHRPAGALARTVGGAYNINGYNWGGYVATGTTFTSVSATWTEPSVTCNTSNDLYAPWVGIDGYSSSTVEQTGVATDCSSGSPIFQAWYEMYPASPVYLSRTTYPVAAGNSIHASVVYAGSHKYTLTISNTSRGWTYTTSKTLSSARNASAEAIIESPTGSYPKFALLTFTSVTVNGSALGKFSNVALDPSANGVYEARTSGLSGGTSFTETYLHR